MGLAVQTKPELAVAPSQTHEAVPGLPASCRVTIVHSLSQFRALEQDWCSLEQDNMIAPHVFQSFSWCNAWAETYLDQHDSASALQVVAGYDGNRLVFAFPLMTTRHMGLKKLGWLTEPFGQYGDVLCAKGQNAKLWIKTAIELIKRFNDVDLVHLRHVREDSILASHGLAELTSARVPEMAPYLDLTAYASEEAYDARYTSQQRKRRKKIRKALEQRGDIAFKQLPPGSLSDAAMKQALEEKAAWLADRGRMNRVMSCPRHLQFLKLLSRQQSDVSFVTTELTAGGNPVSWEIGFRFGGTHFAYITSHVNALTDLSPGRLHMDMSQRAGLAAGLQRFDLMVPDDAHKDSWSSAKMLTNDYYLGVSAKGLSYGHLYLRLLRPMARDIYYWLEPRVLPWLFRKPAVKPASTDA